MADDLILKVNGYYVTGWTSASFTAGVEHFPRAFGVSLTEPIDPQGRATGFFDAGMPIEVFIGSNKVLTGYIDSVSCSLSPTDHSVTITGRGMCEDLSDCSAEIFDSNGYAIMQMGDSTADAIATKLASAYGITVITGTNAKAQMIPLFNVNLGETAYQIIERVGRYAGFLIYENELGNLVLGEPASEPQAAGQLTQGINIETANTEFNLSERYGQYEFYSHSFQSTADQQAAISQSTHYGADSDASHGLAVDPVFKRYNTPSGAPRNRKLIQIADMPLLGVVTAQTRANWEMNRRMGRSQRITISTNSWRDAAGTLFRPNSLCNFSVPACRLTNMTWLICDVTFEKTTRGTECHLTMYPKEAFLIEPFLIAPLQADKLQALQETQNASGRSQSTDGPGL